MVQARDMGAQDTKRLRPEKKESPYGTPNLLGVKGGGSWVPVFVKI